MKAIGDRVAAWWAAWKWVLILALALAASLYANYWQHRRAITAPLRAVIAGQEQALADSEALQASSREAAQRAIDAAELVAARLEGAGAKYRDAMRDRPLTPDNCAPGQARVDATNQAFGSPDAVPPEQQP